jgi:hypothetical protein
VELTGGIPFVSDADLEAALDDAHVSKNTADAIVDENSQARLSALRNSLAIVGVVALLAMFFVGSAIPNQQPRSPPVEAET